VLAALKIRGQSVLYLLGYALFIPFIVWWDPFEPKWFLIPNIFFAGFLSCGLQPWLRRKATAVIVVSCALAIGVTNFVTTIRPRHTQIGTDRTVAQCVAGHMKAADVFIASEWGWPDYLEYLHGRKTLNLINAGGAGERIFRAREIIASAQRAGGDAYLADPRSHSESHLEWLNVQTGLTLADLLAFGGLPSFNCSDRTILKLPAAPRN
jgi:hypothetical protein